MKVDKKTFLKNVTILIDSREQQISHILEKFDAYKVNYRIQSLDVADYSFEIDGISFAQSCVIERKANVDEFYGNTTHDRGRIEKEFEAGSKLMNQFVLLIENCASWEKLKNFAITNKEMERQGRKVKEIGKHCYYTLRSWQCGNRYKFDTSFVKNNEDTAREILERFYYYWRNYKELTKNRSLKGGRNR